MFACAYSNNNVVTMLLYFGADPNKKENGGWTPFPTVCKNGHKGIVQLLVNTKVDVNACLEDGSMGIYFASGCSHSGVVPTLLQFGADANLKTNDRWTPLMIACHNCQLNAVELLPKAKVDVNLV